VEVCDAMFIGVGVARSDNSAVGLRVSSLRAERGSRLKWIC
jgi:hypothetical protein